MSANERQVGGQHYKTKYQHWDFAAELELCYFEGQITKYVYRHDKKKGREDLEKALHFAQKLCEVRSAGPAMAADRGKFAIESALEKLFAHSELDNMEQRAIRAAVSWLGMQELRSLVKLLAELLELRYPAAADPSSGYVNQG